MDRKARRFGLIDAMILLAATAVGLAWGREELVATVEASAIPTGTVLHGVQGTRPVEFADRILSFNRGASRLLACWTLAVLVLRLRPPRPGRARLMCQPGMVAVSMATAYTVAVAGGFLLAWLIRARYKPAWSDYTGQAIPPYEIATAIAASWLVLALSGRWRPERSWIDRSGCLVGLAWILLTTAGNLFDWW